MILSLKLFGQNQFPSKRFYIFSEKQTNGRKIDKWTKNGQMDETLTNGRNIDKWTKS